MALRKILILALSAFSVAASAGESVYLEQNGVVVMEAENTPSDLGKWIAKTTVSDFKGTGHLEFTGNAPSNGDADSPLTYRFKIQTAGTYTLKIRAHKRLDGAPSDYCNDCYVKLSGNFDEAGTPMSWLTSNTKLYGGSASGWDWAATLDKNHEKKPPKYALKSGEVYTLTVSGRSQRFNIDRIFFSTGQFSDSAPESPLDNITQIGSKLTVQSVAPPLGSPFSLYLLDGRALTRSGSETGISSSVSAGLLISSFENRASSTLVR